MHLFLKIATLPSQSADVRALVASGIKPPGNYKKPETIAKWEAEDKPAAVEAALRATAFDGTLGHVAAIAWAWDDGGIRTACGAFADLKHADGDPNGPVVGICVDVSRERDALATFFGDLGEAAAYRPISICGHGLAWQTRFLWQRAVLNGVQTPECWPIDACLWTPGVAATFDTAERWAGTSRDREAIDLPTLRRVLLIGEAGSGDVACELAAGGFEETADFLASDVDTIRACHRRLWSQELISAAEQ